MPTNTRNNQPTANSAVANVAGSDLVASQKMFTAEQIDLIKTQIAPPETTDDELMLFVQVSNSRGLDPFRKHVYLVKRWDSNRRENKMTIQVSIDGLRLIADRSGEYEGQTAPRWCGPDGEWREVWTGEGYPTAALVGVYRKGFREPVVAVARWSTYAQTTKEGAVTSMWSKMPDLMLAKCAEALALRKAFPEKAGGLYTQEEMDQADYIDVEPGRVQPGPNPRQQVDTPTTNPTKDDLKRQIWGITNGNWGWSKDDVEAVSKLKTKKAVKDLTSDELTAFYRLLVGLSDTARKKLLDDATKPVAAAPAPLSDDDGRDEPPTAVDADGVIVDV